VGRLEQRVSGGEPGAALREKVRVRVQTFAEHTQAL
jgi:hypothetical protein